MTTDDRAIIRISMALETSAPAFEGEELPLPREMLLLETIDLGLADDRLSAARVLLDDAGAGSNSLFLRCVGRGQMVWCRHVQSHGHATLFVAVLSSTPAQTLATCCRMRLFLSFLHFLPFFFVSAPRRHALGLHILRMPWLVELRECFANVRMGAAPSLA